MTKIKLKLLSILILALGAFIYVLFREEVIFTDFLTIYFGKFPLIVLPENDLSNLIKYNLPDALWCLSLIVYTTTISNKFLIAICLFIPPLMELAQLVGVIPGTFDFYDLFIYII